ncbi:MAG: hypothetical protein LUH00_02385 [Lachnospiraceae bacterium]|nr:hypothetical protein [Lachnospiraceae bacterium]
MNNQVTLTEAVEGVMRCLEEKGYTEFTLTNIRHTYKEIRQVSGHTIDSYRESLNSYIDYLETIEHINRKEITFHDFDKNKLKKIPDLDDYSPETCAQDMQPEDDRNTGSP